MKVGIGEAAQILGVTVETVRRWERSGKIKSERTPNGHRRFDSGQLGKVSKHSGTEVRKTVGYARISSRDQKADLESQKQILEAFCAANGWEFAIISDLGSGMNYHKKGLRQLLHEILENKIGRLVITHKDRLLRFGTELVFAICEAKNVEVVIINKGECATFEEDLAQDVLEMITVFSARLYGSQSRKNQKLIEGMKKAAADAS